MMHLQGPISEVLRPRNFRAGMVRWSFLVLMCGFFCFAGAQSDSSSQILERVERTGLAANERPRHNAVPQLRISDDAYPKPQTRSTNSLPYNPANERPVPTDRWLTMFSCPKGLKNPVVLQNEELALRSWLAFHPPVEIVLIAEQAGNGVPELAARYGVRYEVLQDTDFSPSGTPLLSSVFQVAEHIAPKDGLMMYINADIVLPANAPAVIKSVLKRVREPEKLLMTGQRTDCSSGLNYEDQDVMKRNRMLVRYMLLKNITDAGVIENYFGHCVPHGNGGKDYFVYKRGLWERLGSPMLSFALGRPAFDDWMLLMAHHFGIALDASPVLGALHLQHDYKHVESVGSGSRLAIFKGADRRYNMQLMRMSFRNLGVKIRNRTELWGSLMWLPHFRVCPAGNSCRGFRLEKAQRDKFAQRGKLGATVHSMGVKQYSMLFACSARCSWRFRRSSKLLVG